MLSSMGGNTTLAPDTIAPNRGLRNRGFTA